MKVILKETLGFDGVVGVLSRFVSDVDESGCVIDENCTPFVHDTLAFSPSFPGKSSWDWRSIAINGDYVTGAELGATDVANVFRDPGRGGGARAAHAGAGLLAGGTEGRLAGTGSCECWRETWVAVVGELELGIGAATHEELDVLEREMRQAVMKEKKFALSASYVLICFVKNGKISVRTACARLICSL
jgi:hypothetical protein